MQSNASAFLLPFVGYPTGMADVRKIVGDNIRVLQEYARDHNRPCSDDKSLGLRAKVEPSTVGRIRKGMISTGIETLESIANVYKLSAWQLLIPNLDPANPPVVPYTDTERALYWRIRSVAAEFVRTGKVEHDEDETPGSGAIGSPRPHQANPDSGPPAKPARTKAK